MTTQGAYVRSVAGRIVVTRKDEELTALPKAMVEAVLLFGAVQVSTQAVQTLLEEGIPLVYLSRGGTFRGMLQSGEPKNAEVRLGQYAAVTDPRQTLRLARGVLRGKLRAAGACVQLWGRNRWVGEIKGVVAELREVESRLDRCESTAQLRAAEGRAAAAVFGLFGEALPPGFFWKGRNRRPPQDPANALLSMAYMLLLGRAMAACYAVGLDPQLGVLHEVAYGRPSLALDLLEPLRTPCCEHFVLRALQAETFDPSDFRMEEATGCRMTADALNRFLPRFQAWMDGEAGRQGQANLPELAREFRSAIMEEREPVWPVEREVAA
ncbi:MAG: CRISPR-associated endonuclease Cas1 [Kiritimatiellae bacterium]|nr:CRISPR-associated endonuclease Cas1 [Kiritimatiellia bacterium]